MDKISKKGLLAVSFGTSVNASREKTIDAIEADFKEAFPDYTLYRAWTSRVIIEKLKKRDGIQIDTVGEALERMLADGVTEVVVQPTHVISGIENEQMTADILTYRDQFAAVRFGTPLLVNEEDFCAVIKAVMTEFKHISREEALVFMGHGTPHNANSTYSVLSQKLKDMGYENVFLGTVESGPSINILMQQVHAYGAKRVTLAPFMVVAGDHALNDMSGDDKDSWRKQLEASGFIVNCVLKGLGEYPGIRRLYIKHIQDAIERAALRL